jgi:heme O synthase-like polyprenyltransferase
VQEYALAVMLFATALLSAGIFAVNQYLERETDRLMQRTADRALPGGGYAPKPR